MISILHTLALWLPYLSYLVDGNFSLTVIPANVDALAGPRVDEPHRRSRFRTRDSSAYHAESVLSVRQLAISSFTTACTISHHTLTFSWWYFHHDLMHRSFRVEWPWTFPCTASTRGGAPDGNRWGIDLGYRCSYPDSLIEKRHAHTLRSYRCGWRTCSDLNERPSVESLLCSLFIAVVGIRSLRSCYLLDRCCCLRISRDVARCVT